MPRDFFSILLDRLPATETTDQHEDDPSEPKTGGKMIDNIRREGTADNGGGNNCQDQAKHGKGRQGIRCSCNSMLAGYHNLGALDPILSRTEGIPFHK